MLLLYKANGALIFFLNFKILPFFSFPFQIQNNSALNKMEVYLTFRRKSGSKVVQDFSSDSATQTTSFPRYV